ncbi:MAG: hypothetical protein LQ342_002250 [Letrouitia transgressa]|nr:MAG: hypothetical protein LQ342_002250 [Letrouitia transgressa]
MGRVLSQPLLLRSLCSRCLSRCQKPLPAAQHRRPLHITAPAPLASPPPSPSPISLSDNSKPSSPRGATPSPAESIFSALSPNIPSLSPASRGGGESPTFLLGAARRPPTLPPMHKLHVYSTKHNTHITLSAPFPSSSTVARMAQKRRGSKSENESKAPTTTTPATAESSSLLSTTQEQPQSQSQPLAATGSGNTLVPTNTYPRISVSCGSIGFRKSHRGSYDAAYQLSSYVMARIQNEGLLAEMQLVEVVLRGFGRGREAFVKVLLGAEGRRVRGCVARVSDGTRVKFGGTRGKKPRRLG